MTITLLIISVILNIMFVWYVIQLVKRFLLLSDNMEEFFEKLEEYSKHIDIVHGLERFYGDETLGNLLKHSKSILEETKSIRGLYNLNDEKEDINDEKEDITELEE